MNARAPGVALVMAIVVLLLIEVMSAGMLALATQTRLVVDSQMRTARADATALRSAQTVLQGWLTRGFDMLPVGREVKVASASGAAEDASWSATIERASSAMWVIRSTSRVGDGNAYSLSRTVAIARTLDPISAATDPPTDSIPLGGLNWLQLQGIADRILRGHATLADSTGVPLSYAPGDLTIAGYGRGILIVRGTLTIESAAAFEGLIVVLKDVVVENGAVVSGAVRCVSGVVRGDADGVEVAQNVVQAVLSAAPARLRVVSEVRRFLPAF